MRRSGHGPLSSPAAAIQSSTQARTARDPDAPRCPAGSELPRTPGHRSPVPGLFEVVVKAGQRDGAPYGLRRDSGPDAPPPHEQALVYQLLYRRAHGGTADPQPPREIRLALQRAPPAGGRPLSPLPEKPGRLDDTAAQGCCGRASLPPERSIRTLPHSQHYHPGNAMTSLV
jgi:hypothetical protein